MRQVFHQTRENPQIQALATARFRGDQRDLVRAFFYHATAEVGHDQLALDDIRAIGMSTEGIHEERPLPATFALLSSAFHMIEHHSPVAYLGYMFHLAYTPVQLGRMYMDCLERAGIPRSAMTFLDEHATVDVAHVKLIRRYLELMVKTQDDLDSIVYMTELTADLYARMMEQAIATADKWEGTTPTNPVESRTGVADAA